MSHDHHHHHAGTQNLRVAFFLNLTFTLIELVGGLLTNSVAILSDALHDLGDSISLGLAWYLENYSERGATQQYSYGYRRYSLLSAMINAIILILGSIFVVNEAVQRLAEPEMPNAQGMVLIAILGVAVNGLAAWRLRGGESKNVQTVSWHLLEDVLGWVAVLIVSVILLFWEVPILDPLLSIGIAIFILYNIVQNLRETLSLFLQAVPADVDLAQTERQLGGIDGVQSTHHTHIWSLDGERNVLTTHLVVADDVTIAQMQQVKRQAIQIANELDVAHVTIEIELENEDCRMRPDTE